MRALPLLFVLLLLCDPALAQVTVDPGALEPLTPPTPTTQTPATKPKPEP